MDRFYISPSDATAHFCHGLTGRTESRGRSQPKVKARTAYGSVFRLRDAWRCAAVAGSFYTNEMGLEALEEANTSSFDAYMSWRYTPILWAGILRNTRLRFEEARLPLHRSFTSCEWEVVRVRAVVEGVHPCVALCICRSI